MGQVTGKGTHLEEITMHVRTFSLWPEGKFKPEWTHEHFFLQVLPIETEEWRPAGRFTGSKTFVGHRMEHWFFLSANDRYGRSAG